MQLLCKGCYPAGHLVHLSVTPAASDRITVFDESCIWLLLQSDIPKLWKCLSGEISNETGQRVCCRRGMAPILQTDVKITFLVTVKMRRQSGQTALSWLSFYLTGVTVVVLWGNWSFRSCRLLCYITAGDSLALLVKISPFCRVMERSRYLFPVIHRQTFQFFLPLRHPLTP